MNKIKNFNLGLVWSSCAAAILANLIALEVYLEYYSTLSTLSDIVFYLCWLVFAILLILIGVALLKKEYKLSSQRAAELFYVTVISSGILMIVSVIAFCFDYQNRGMEIAPRTFFSELVITWPALPLIIYANLIALLSGSKSIKLFAILSVSAASLMIAYDILTSQL